MGMREFMATGNGEFIREYKAGEPYTFSIGLYEIGEPNFIGVVYGKQDRQVQSRQWWKGRIPDYVPPPPIDAPALKTIQPRKKAAVPLAQTPAPEPERATTPGTAQGAAASLKIQPRKKLIPAPAIHFTVAELEAEAAPPPKIPPRKKKK